MYFNNLSGGLFHPLSNKAFEKVNEFVNNHPQLQKMISSNKTDNMEFFSKLAEMESVDISIRIMKKNDKLTLNIMPGSGNATIKPVLVTGTAKELDEGFFTMLMPKYNEISGLITNISEVEKELKEKPVKEKVTEKPTKQSSDKKAENTKTEVVKKSNEPDLFGNAVEPAAATEEEFEEELEDDK